MRGLFRSLAPRLALTAGVGVLLCAVTAPVGPAWSTTTSPSARLAAGSAAESGAAPPSFPVTGPPVAASMKVWINTAEQLMKQYQIPGASLAVAFEGRVVLEAGIGYADVATHAPVEPDSLFELASVAKPITATVVGMLIGEHKLSLDTEPFATVLSGLRGRHGSMPVDPRIKAITIGQLLLHEGGWDISKLGYDPTSDPAAQEKALGLHSDPSCEDAIDYMLSVKLNFTPGTKSVYSNFGYCVLAETIAQVTHMPYSEAVEEMLLKPLRMNDTVPSPTYEGQQLRPGEVHYYGQAGEATGLSSPAESLMTAGTGAFSWISDGPDLERFLITTAATLPDSTPFPSWPNIEIGGQGLVGVSPPPGRQRPPPPNQGTLWSFDGSQPGDSAEIAVFGPITYVMLANSRNPNDFTDFAPLQNLAQGEMVDPASSWPAGNLLVSPAS